MRSKQYVLLVNFLLCGFIHLTAQIPQGPSPKILVGKLPMVFEPANNRKEDSAGMIGRMVGGTVRFQSAAIEIGAAGASSMPITFDGAQLSAPRGVDLEQSETNYLLGNDPAFWRTHVPNYGKVVYSGLYNGIDAVFYGNGDRLEHDFIVKPGADYRQIRMHFPANSQVRREQDGALAVVFAGNSLRLSVPFIYQIVHNKRRQLHGDFQLQPNGDVGFAVAGYDPHYELIIDPSSISLHICPRSDRMGLRLQPMQLATAM